MIKRWIGLNTHSSDNTLPWWFPGLIFFTFFFFPVFKMIITTPLDGKVFLFYLKNQNIYLKIMLYIYFARKILKILIIVSVLLMKKIYAKYCLITAIALASFTPLNVYADSPLTSINFWSLSKEKLVLKTGKKKGKKLL